MQRNVGNVLKKKCVLQLQLECRNCACSLAELVQCRTGVWGVRGVHVAVSVSQVAGFIFLPNEKNCFL